MAEQAEIRCTSSRVVYTNAWMTVREDDVRHADGSTGIFGVVDKRDFALVLPRGDGGFWMVEQYRYPVRRRAWEFPQGSWDSDSRRDPVELARTELAEETGLEAAEFQHLGHLLQAYGFSTQGFDVYLATGLVEGVPQRGVTEQDMIHGFIRDDELTRMIRSHEIVDSASLAALTLYALANPASEALIQ